MTRCRRLTVELTCSGKIYRRKNVHINDTSNRRCNTATCMVSTAPIKRHASSSNISTWTNTSAAQTFHPRSLPPPPFPPDYAFTPPGTGKTFLGVLLAQAILSSTSEKILCVCYTNHALDSFLEDMLSKGITNIVRIGGGSKNPKLDPYQLRSRQAPGFDRVQNRQFAHLKGALEESQESIDNVQRVSRLNSKPEKMTVVAWLEDEDADAFRELQMPDGLGGAGDTVVGKKVGVEGRRGSYGV